LSSESKKPLKKNYISKLFKDKKSNQINVSKCIY